MIESIVIVTVTMGGWIVLAVLISRDTERKGGPFWKTLVLSFVFWPAAFYIWARQRGRADSGSER